MAGLFFMSLVNMHFYLQKNHIIYLAMCGFMMMGFLALAIQIPFQV